MPDSMLRNYSRILSLNEFHNHDNRNGYRVFNDLILQGKFILSYQVSPIFYDAKIVFFKANNIFFVFSKSNLINNSYLNTNHRLMLKQLFKIFANLRL